MLALRSLFYFLLKYPLKLRVSCKIVPDKIQDVNPQDPQKPIFYVVRHQSASDLLTLQIACEQNNLPDPLSPVIIKGKSFPRTFCLEKPTTLFFSKYRSNKTTAIAQGVDLLYQHTQDPTLNAQLIPVNLIWGRTPTKEKNTTDVSSLLIDQESPSWLKKFFIVLWLGSNTLIRFSDALSFRYIAEQQGNDEKAAQKLLRVARFHFHRQTIAAKGPRLMDRQQMFDTLFANPIIKNLIEEEAKSKQFSPAHIEKQARAMMYEIAGNYSDKMIRFGERILHWLWNKLYSGIEVRNAKVLRELAQNGQEIIYLPCHRSHMDYLLLTYVIFHEGLVTPRIAAGINLSFWPAGPIFRKAGAFFIRRSFGGNRLYSTIFREYLSLLFERGYSVKYYTEGGRSRTGKLLTPKTGMLAMTIQSLLRGVDRPLTIVPVYIGYEHVMEVGTYYEELSGNKKKKESLTGVFNAIKKLRNYGKGFVSFGEPINLNHYLNEQVPDWKNDIDAYSTKKPSWLTPKVNILANQVMTAINQSVALNGVALVALILHSTKNKALTETELITQLNFFLFIQQQAPYSQQLSLPEESSTDLLAHVIQLNKVTVDTDHFGQIISLSPTAALEMRYYRNNILHAYMLPALICRILERHAKIAQDELITTVQSLMVLLKNDLFLCQSPEQITQQSVDIINALLQQHMIKKTKAGFISITDDIQLRANIRILGECADETIQRIAIITTLMKRIAPLSKSDLETQAVEIAKRLSVINNINAPEFVDKKAQASIINAMKNEGYILTNDQAKLVADDSLNELNHVIATLVDIEVLQSINS